MALNRPVDKINLPLKDRATARHPSTSRVIIIQKDKSKSLHKMKKDEDAKPYIRWNKHAREC